MIGVRSVLVVGLTLATLPALAAPRAAALVPAMRPAAAVELRDKFHDAVSRGLSSSGLDVLAPAEVRMRLSGNDEQLQCSSAGACAARAAASLRVEYTVGSEVVIAGKDYTYRLRLLDASGKELAKTEDTCDICTQKEAEDGLTKAASRLVGLNKSMLEAQPAPPQAAVEQPAPPPPPPKAVEATPPAATPPSAALTPPPPSATREKKPFPWRWVAIGSLVVGAVGIVIGAPLVAIDGHPTCNAPAGEDPKSFCKNVYNTAGGGGAMLALGIGGLAASGVLFYFDWRSRHTPSPSRVSIVPLDGGAMAVMGTRF